MQDTLREGNGWKVSIRAEDETIMESPNNKFTRFGTVQFVIPVPQPVDEKRPPNPANFLSLRINDVDDLPTIAAKFRAFGGKLEIVNSKLKKYNAEGLLED